MERIYYVYILTNDRHTVLYTGSTDDLADRIDQHRRRKPDSFSARYNVFKLVYMEAFPTRQEAYEAERMIKGWKRKRKIVLITSRNPTWKDLSKDIS